MLARKVSRLQTSFHSSSVFASRGSRCFPPCIINHESELTLYQHQPYRGGELLPRGDAIAASEILHSMGLPPWSRHRTTSEEGRIKVVRPRATPFKPQLGTYLIAGRIRRTIVADKMLTIAAQMHWLRYKATSDGVELLATNPTLLLSSHDGFRLLFCFVRHRFI